MFSRPERAQSAADITIGTNSLAAIELDDHDWGQGSCNHKPRSADYASGVGEGGAGGARAPPTF